MNNWYTNINTGIVMFDVVLNAQLAGQLLKYNFQCWKSHMDLNTLFRLFFNEIAKILIVKQMVKSHKAIYKRFDSGNYHKYHYIFKSKSCDFHNCKTFLFRSNDIRMARNLMVIHRDLDMWKVLQAIISSADFNSMIRNNNNTNKLYLTQRKINICIGVIYFSFCLRVIWLAKINQ